LTEARFHALAVISPLFRGAVASERAGINSSRSTNSGFLAMTRRLTATLTIALSLGGALPAFPALAQSCGEDLQKLVKKSGAEMAVVNAMIADAKRAGKQIDPVAYCARSAGYNAAESALVAYMEKNKEWCEIPDQALAQRKENLAKSVAFSAKACKVAAEVKKRQREGAAPEAQALPAGPL
jgi:hypothetical protein